MRTRSRVLSAGGLVREQLRCVARDPSRGPRNALPANRGENFSSSTSRRIRSRFRLRGKPPRAGREPQLRCVSELSRVRAAGRLAPNRERTSAQARRREPSRGSSAWDRLSANTESATAQVRRRRSIASAPGAQARRRPRTSRASSPREALAANRERTAAHARKRSSSARVKPQTCIDQRQLRVLARTEGLLATSAGQNPHSPPAPQAIRTSPSAPAR